MAGILGLSVAGAFAPAHAMPNTGSGLAVHSSGPTVLSVELVTSAKKVISSTHHPLRLRLQASRSVGATSASTYATTVESRDGTESHTWTFPMKAAALHYTSHGKGTLRLGKPTLGSYGSVSLSFAPHGKSRLTRCNAVPLMKSQPVVIKGTLLVSTKSHGAHRWGSVGGPHRRFEFIAATFRFNYDVSGTACGGGPMIQQCDFGTGWTAGHGDLTISGGDPTGPAPADVDGERTVKLSKPSGGTRTDSLTGTSHHLVIISEGSTVALPVQASGGHAHGDSALTSTSPESTSTTSCATSTPENVDLWLASYSNSAPKLSLRGQIFGAMALPTDTPAEIFRITKGPMV